jgi:hypothetical protein
VADHELAAEGRIADAIIARADPVTLDEGAAQRL